MIVSKRSAAKRALLASCALAACPLISYGGVTFVSGSSVATWTFDPDTNGGSQLTVLKVTPPPSSAGMPNPPSYQLNKTYTLGNSSSTAKGSIGYVVNSTTATFTLAAGTGVTQNDPNNANYTGNSLLKVDFTGLFTVDTSFGPPATGYVSIAVGGSVGAGGSTSFSGKVDFRNVNAGQLMRPTVNLGGSFTTAGAFSKVFTSSAILNPTAISNGTQIRVDGSFSFTASNHRTQGSNIVPLDIEFGSAPPTATAYLTGNATWGNSNTWSGPAGSFTEDLGTPPPIPPDDDYGGGEGPIITFAPEMAMSYNFLPNHFPHHHPNPNPQPQPPPIDYSVQSIPTVPNGAGQRARFLNLNGSWIPRIITLDRNITIGSIDGKGNLIFNSYNNSSFTIETGGPNGAVEQRNVDGSRVAIYNVKFLLKNSLEVYAEGSYVPGSFGEPTAAIFFNKEISSQNGSGIYKYGEGYAALNAKNTYTGGTFVRGGKLDGNTAGAFGTGNVEADDGVVGYNARYAAKIGSTVEAKNGGQIDLGVTPVSTDKFIVRELSVISGTPTQLSALNNSPSSNFQIDPRGIVAHEAWNTGTSGNPQGLGSTPQYIYGIHNNFTGTARSITVGTGTTGPWIGFSNDRYDRTFGSSPFTNNEIVNVSGNAILASPHQTLFLNAKLVSVGSASTHIDVLGKGVVAINNKNNAYTGDIAVRRGSTLLVNGNLPGTAGVQVEDGAVLGGGGNIGGPVHVDGYDYGADFNFIGGVIAPGGNKPSDRIGTLTTGPLTLGYLSYFDFEFLDATHYDKLIVNGNLSFDAAFSSNGINIHDLGDFGPGSYTLIQLVGGTITDNPFFFEDIVPNDDLIYDLDWSSGTSLVLNVSLPGPVPLSALIPEPATAGLLLVAGAAGMARRRRQR